MVQHQVSSTNDSPVSDPLKKVLMSLPDVKAFFSLLTATLCPAHLPEVRFLFDFTYWLKYPALLGIQDKVKEFE
jgi:hypothetical protein